MKNRIIICGGNGAGKSTLGKALSIQLGWVFKDIEDYYFPMKDADYVYEVQRTQDEVQDLLLQDLNMQDNFILAAVKGDYGQEIAGMFTCAILIHVPKEIRMERVRDRSYQKFGDRMLPGGDLYEKEKSFFDLVEKRTDDAIIEWLKTAKIPVIEVNGTRTISENVLLIQKELLRR